MDIRRNCLLGSGIEKTQRTQLLKEMNFFRTVSEFNDHKYTLGMEYYKSLYTTNPPRKYVIPYIPSLPIYIHGLHLGVWFSNRRAKIKQNIQLI